MYIDEKIVELPLLHHPAYSLVTTHCGSHNGTANGPRGWSRPQPTTTQGTVCSPAGEENTALEIHTTLILCLIFLYCAGRDVSRRVISYSILPSSLHQYSYWYCSSEGDFKNVVSRSKAVCKLKNVSHQQLFILTFKTARTGLTGSLFIYFLSRSFVYSYLDSP